MKTTRLATGQNKRKFEMLEQADPYFNVTRRARGSLQEIFINAFVKPGQTVADLYRQSCQWLAGQQASIVCVDVLARTEDVETLGIAELAHLPVTYLTNSEQGLAGIYIWAVQGVEVRTIRYQDKVIGRFFEDADCRYCRLAGVLPQDITATHDVQTEQVFEGLQAGLAQVDMAYEHVVRTWFYNDRITDWYDVFNRVRTDLYNKLGVFDRLVPASTGIGSCNAQQAALVGGLLAVVPKHDKITISMVDSPMQGEAWDYGSSFSRATEVICPSHHYLTVSGTASIDPDGATVHLDDVAKQTELTLQVVDKILSHRGFHWTDVTRAYAYFKYAKDAHHFNRALQVLELPKFPCIVVKNDVCRDNLLFEIELDALK